MKKIAFTPVATPDARILILGSMPGEESLRRQEYYAHPRNLFWQIMGNLLFFSPTLPYAERLEQLQKNHIALWDVLAACSRDGSLDSDIKSPEPNDLSTFIQKHPSIEAIYCNGQTAYKFLKKFHSELLHSKLFIGVLPSTSPAHASLSPLKKSKEWSIILR